jgi:hypothetical protein
MSLFNSSDSAVPVSPKRRNSDGATDGEAQEATPLLSARRRPLIVKNSNRSMRTQVICALIAFIIFWLLLLNGGTFTVYLPLADPALAPAPTPAFPVKLSF